MLICHITEYSKPKCPLSEVFWTWADGVKFSINILFATIITIFSFKKLMPVKYFFALIACSFILFFYFLISLVHLSRENKE